MWSILIVTLPTQPNAVRLRIWRALKALGCAALRDGAYLLPAAQRRAVRAARRRGARARRHGHGADAVAAGRGAARRTAGAVRPQRGLRPVARHAPPRCRPNSPRWPRPRRGAGCAPWPTRLQALRRIDYYPGAAAEQAQVRRCDVAAPGARRPLLQGRAAGAARPRHRRGWTRASSRANAGPRARAPGSTGWPAPG